MEKGRVWGKRWMRDASADLPCCIIFTRSIYGMLLSRLILKVLLEGYNKVPIEKNPICYSLYEYTKKILKKPIF